MIGDRRPSLRKALTLAGSVLVLAWAISITLLFLVIAVVWRLSALAAQ